MACLCRNTAEQLQALVAAQASASAGASASADVSASAQADVPLLGRMAAALSLRGLPAPPWQPQAAWLQAPLPPVALSASAMATVSAFAQLRAEVQAQAGINLLVPAQASAFARITATVNARLSAMLATNPSLPASVAATATAWAQLSAALHAVTQVEAALAGGLLARPLPPVPPQAQPFLGQLRPLLPLIAAASQLGVDLRTDFTAALSAALRPMLRLTLPPVPPASMELMANLTATFGAMAQVRATLNISVTALATVQAAVAARATALVQQLQATLRISLDTALQRIEAQPVSPALYATPDVIAVAQSVNVRALAALTWQVPAVASLPVLTTGLPVAAFLAQMRAATGLAPAVSPCGAGCDAQSLLRQTQAA